MKNFSVKSGFGIGAIILAVAALIALPVRTIQFFTILEGGTGFFTETDFSVYFIYLVLIAAGIAFLVLGIFKRKKTDYCREVKKQPVFGVFSLIAAAGAFSDGIICAVKVMNDRLPIVDYDYMGTPIINTEKLLFSAEAVFAVLSAIFFLAIALSAITGKTNGSEHKLISLAPVLWCVIRMIFRFTRTISYLKVSDLTFELVMLVFATMFFMAFAQVNSQINSKNCEWKLAGYGLTSALFALVCFVPRLIVTIVGISDLLYSYSPAEFCDLAIALFMIVTVFTKLTDKKEQEIITVESTVKE